MTVQPIDLQNLFLRLDQVGGEQAARQEAALQQQAAVASELKHQSEQNEHQINRSDSTSEGPNNVKDDDGAHNQHENSEQEDSHTKKEDQETVRDPELGQNVDLSG